MKVLGFDPSFRNWGYVKGDLDVSTGVFTPEVIGVLSYPVEKAKTVRKNSKDIEYIVRLIDDLVDLIDDVSLIFAEVPHGSQGARASVGYGVCVALLAVIQQSGKSLIEVSATEVKAVVGTGKVTKKLVIEWVTERFPDLNYPMSRGKLASSVEHIADAIVTVHAGLCTQEFLRIKPLLKE